jgi:chromosome segregation ATPase
MALSAEEKRRFLRSLDEDIEFRYAVAGYLGISEILKRLDSLEESMLKLWENQNKLWEELRSLREGQDKLREETRSLREDVNALKIDVSTLKDDVNTLKIDVSTLKSDVNALKNDVREIRTTLDRLTLTVEEEARSMVKYKIKEKLNVEIELSNIFIDSKEVDIYGADDEICIIGEATVRLGVKLVNELLDKVELIKSKRPDLLRKRIIKVIYTDYAAPEAIEAARNNGVWILRWDKDLTPMVIEAG